MSDVVKTTVSVDVSAILDKVNRLKDNATMTEIHTAFYKMIDPWVPYLNGPLSTTVNITADYVDYLMPYAHYQYYGIGFNHTTDHHPLATAQWDKVAMQTQRDSFVATVEAILKRRAKEIW